MFQKPPRILLRADLLTPDHVQVIERAVEGWATVNRISEKAPAHDEAQAIAAADMVVGWATPGHLLHSPVSLYLCGSAGFDAYEGLGLNQKPGYIHCSAKGTMSVPIAEHALAFMLFFGRRFHLHTDIQKQGQWSRVFDGNELAGSTVCIAGMGGSGAHLAQLCQALAMKVVAVQRSSKVHPSASQTFSPDRLAEAVRQADHVVACLPGGKETYQIFNSEVFAAMKPKAAFYAVSRGSVIDFEALTRSLQDGHVAYAGLDVTDPEPLPGTHPLRSMANVLMTSHSAGWSANLPGRLCNLFVENLLNARKGTPLVNVIPLKS